MTPRYFVPIVAMALMLVSCGGSQRKESGSNWNDFYRIAFITSCVDDGTSLFGSKERAEKYCTCMQQKVEARYPEALEADKITEKEMMVLADSCSQGDSMQIVHSPWDDQARTDFINHCRSQVDSTIAKEQVQGFCNCILEKMEKRSSNVVDISKVPQDEMVKMAQQCQ